MIRSIGIDPGTKSFDVCGIEEENGEIKVFLEESIPSELVAEKPEYVMDLIKKNEPIDALVAPSGYGISLKNIKDLGEDEENLMILVKEKDPGIPVLKGLPKLVRLLKESNYNIFLIPGVIHLPTVPIFRKLNKIDMGTADKLCVAVLAIYEQAKALNISYDSTSFILVELGYAYNAFIAVKEGKIIDGIGGTNSLISFKSLSCIDGELAYLLGDFKKEMLFKGGISDLIKSDDPSNIFSSEIAVEAFFEGIEKAVASLLVSSGFPREIMISGRLSRIESIFKEAKDRLKKYASVRKIRGFSKVKEAAQGAAIIANGLVGGYFKDLIDTVGIKESKGTVLDYIIVKDKKELMEVLR